MRFHKIRQWSIILNKVRDSEENQKNTLPAKLDDLLILNNKSEQLRDHGYNKILRLSNTTDLEELIDKAADRT